MDSLSTAFMLCLLLAPVNLILCIGGWIVDNLPERTQAKIVRWFTGEL